MNADSGIAEPKDLIGKKVGTPEYQMTAGVWIRGILSDEHGVPVNSVTYYTGGEEEPGRPEKLKLDLPADIRVERIGPDRTLSALLDAGEIDALYTARMPSSFRSGSGKVKRLFPDFVAVERDYFRRTGIFPTRGDMKLLSVQKALDRFSNGLSATLQKTFRDAVHARQVHLCVALVRRCRPNEIVRDDRLL